MPRISGVRGFELSKAHTAKQRNGQDTAKKLSAGRDLSTVAQWHTGMCVCVCVCVCVCILGGSWVGHQQPLPQLIGISSHKHLGYSVYAELVGQSYSE